MRHTWNGQSKTVLQTASAMVELIPKALSLGSRWQSLLSGTMMLMKYLMGFRQM